MLDVAFYGVRGSTPCASDSTRRYGGNTSCVVVRVPGDDPLVLDLGTGLRFFGQTQPVDGSFRGTALVTHLHWDHVQGLPFFKPILCPGARLDVYGPRQADGCSFGEALGRFIRPPYFPVTLDQLPGSLAYHDCPSAPFVVGSAKVTAAEIPHVGITNGYRIEAAGASIAYLSDHQQPVDGSLGISDAALSLCEGVDLLIHDAQYTREEFRVKSTWGHCTIDYALWVAKEAGAKRLALFHHDPVRDDDTLDEVVRCMAEAGERLGVEVVAASEHVRLRV